MSWRPACSPPWPIAYDSLAQVHLDQRPLPLGIPAGSELFIVYGDGRTTLSRGVPDLQDHTFALKVTPLFDF